LTLALVLAALLAVLCVVAVALPFLRDPEPESDSLEELDDAGGRRLELVEARDRALAALKELEFDHRTGTVSDEDYRALVGPLRQEAANALQALERGGGKVPGAAEKEEGRPTRERIS
jgi:hypothetical protein